MVVFRRGQAALEFLTTYGWAFLIILVMIGGLAYFGVLDPSSFSGGGNCVSGSEFFCKSSSLSQNFQGVLLRNNLPEGVVISNASVYRNGEVIGVCSAGFEIASESDFEISCSASLQEGKQENLKVEVQWYPSNGVSSYSKSVFVDVKGKVLSDSEFSSFGSGLCPDGFVLIQGSSYFGTSSFCVMKYEAKNNGSGIPVSAESGAPWVSVTFTAARNACVSAGYHLITNREWMTMARAVESNPINWNGTVIPRGNSNSASAMDGTNPLSGVNYRILKVGGSEVWDLAGNVWEWVDLMEDGSSISTGNACGATGWYSVYGNDGVAECSWQNTYAKTGAVDKRFEMGPNGNYNSVNGVGRIYSSTSTGRVLLRGGSWDDGASAGVFTSYLNGGPASSSSSIGFRCVMNTGN